MEHKANNRLFVVAGGAVVALGLLLGVGWFVAPFFAGEPERGRPPVERPRAQARQAKAGRPALGGGPVVYPSDEAAPAAGASAARRGGRRPAGREDRAEALGARVDQYAEAQGWEPALTEQVRGVVLQTLESARETLSEARQAKDRELARSGMQQVREEQERQLTELLGPEATESFVREANLGQFFPRVAERRGGKAGAGGRRGLE